MVRLGDVATYVNGFAFKPADWSNKGIPIIRIQNLTGTSDVVNYYDKKYSTKYEINNGDVLISWSASLGVYEWKKGKALLNQHIFKVVFDKLVLDKRFFVFVIAEKLREMSSLVHGSTMKHITKKYFDRIEIQLPPLESQKKIATALDSANALIEKRKEQIEKLDLLIKSQFIEMFGDPVTNPKGWEIKRLGALTNKITDGVHQKPIYTTYGVPFISVANINKGVLNFDDCKFVSEEDYLKMTKSVKPEQGDILYTKVGATYGIPAFIDTDKRFCLYVSVCLIKPISELINARFLAISMSMPYIKRQADERIRGIGVPDLHLNQISEFNICVPKRVEQEEFVQFVEQVETQKALLKKSLADMEQNYQSLLQKCFKGEIF